MTQGIQTSAATADEFVEFWAAGQSVKGDLTQLIVTNTRNESYPVSQRREIVRHNSG